jgi:hypothetical protein
MISSFSLLISFLFPFIINGFLSSLFSSAPATRTNGGIPDVPNIIGNNRGIAADTMGKYSGSTFLCDGIHLPINKINDNFCDCLDGTDEPGTSACHTGIFTCQNPGFQITKIPSSRVDDRICDCCDGSDEIPSLCPNDCDAIAAQERKSLEIFYQNYLIGSKIKQEKKNEIEKKIQLSYDSMEALAPQLSEVTDKLQQTQQRLEHELVIEKEEMHELTRQLSQQLSSFFEFEKMNEEKMAPLLSVVFSVLDVIEEEIVELLETKQSSSSLQSSSGVTTNERTPTDFGDDVGHHDEESEDPYGDVAVDDGYEDEYHPPVQDEENGEEIVVSLDDDSTSTPPDDPVHYDADNCPLLKHASDDRLHLLCPFYSKETHPLSALQQFFLQFILHRKPLKEIQLLLGFEFISGTFDGAKDFITRILSTTLPPADEKKEGIGSHYCPLEFETHPKLCLIADQLNTLLSTHDVTEYIRPEVKELREQIEQLTHQQNELKKLEVDHEKVINESAEYEPEFYDLLASKGECYDRIDGAFTYTVCLGTKVTQKENGRSQSGVNLGTFSNPQTSIVKEEGSDGVTGRMIPIYKLLYSNGQHCHAFGARKAEVFITCGEKNKLLDATEPSTCAYSFKFESPIACSESYAKAYGFEI